MSATNDLSKRDRRILAAMRRGTQTSAGIARALRSTQPRIAVAIARLKERGFVERAATEARATPGRPYVRWRARGEGRIARAGARVDDCSVGG